MKINNHKYESDNDVTEIIFKIRSVNACFAYPAPLPKPSLSRTSILGQPVKTEITFNDTWELDRLIKILQDVQTMTTGGCDAPISMKGDQDD